MVSIYDLKPKFQQLLSPIVEKLHEKEITANQVTLIAFAMSVVYGLVLYFLIEYRFFLLLFPIVLLLRMALNAIDGMLAKQYSQQSNIGVLLNELTDILADAALYLPFAMHSGIFAPLVIVCVVFAITTEAAGLCGLLINASRRYDGPMGKSDRALAFSIVALWLVFYHANFYLNAFIGLIALLTLTTIFNRCYRALEEVA